MSAVITIGGIYRHYSRKGLFKVLNLAKNEIDRVDVVVYLALDDGRVWVRTLNEFVGQVKLGDGFVERFSLVRDEADPRQMSLFGTREDEVTLDELPAAGTEMICSICLNAKGSEKFCICPRCGDLVCHACLSEVVDNEGKRICVGCEEELKEEYAIREQ